MIPSVPKIPWWFTVELIFFNWLADELRFRQSQPRVDFGCLENDDDVARFEKNCQKISKKIIALKSLWLGFRERKRKSICYFTVLHERFLIPGDWKNEIVVCCNKNYKKLSEWAVVVPQLVGRLFPTPEIRGSNPVIGEIFMYFLSTVKWKDENK